MVKSPLSYQIVVAKFRVGLNVGKNFIKLSLGANV